jgi:hypothetical protein
MERKEDRNNTKSKLNYIDNNRVESRTWSCVGRRQISNKFYKNDIRVFLWIKAICRIILIERKTSKYFRKRFTFKDKNICWWWWIIWSFSWLLAILILFLEWKTLSSFYLQVFYIDIKWCYSRPEKNYISTFLSNVPFFMASFLSFVALMALYRWPFGSFLYQLYQFLIFWYFYHVDFMTLTW